MGDHRASIKIEMEFHGIKDKCEMYINYCPEYCCNMDSRVVEFIDNVYTRGMEAYDKLVAKAYAKEHKDRIENEEKAELDRLKKKYEV